MLLPEIIAVGIYDSDIAVKNTKVSKNRNTTMFEIELPINDGGVSFIDSNSCAITPDMVICAKPNQIRHTKFPFKCYYVHMIVPEGQLYDILYNIQDFFVTTKHEKYEKIFLKLIKHYDSLSKNEDLILQSLVLELIYTLSKDSATKLDTPKSTNNNYLIENAIKYIKEHLTEELSLEEIAKVMSLSPTYFHKTFKASTGKTLHDFVEEQRIKKAINLLQTTNFSLTKIAYECGFSSQSYFSYVFKRRMKVTPREYVKEIYNKYEI